MQKASFLEVAYSTFDPNLVKINNKKVNLNWVHTTDHSSFIN